MYIYRYKLYYRFWWLASGVRRVSGYRCVFADARGPFELAGADREGNKKSNQRKPLNWFVFADGPLARRKTRNKKDRRSLRERTRSLRRSDEPPADSDHKQMDYEY